MAVVLSIVAFGGFYPKVQQLYCRPTAVGGSLQELKELYLLPVTVGGFQPELKCSSCSLDLLLLETFGQNCSSYSLDQ